MKTGTTAFGNQIPISFAIPKATSPPKVNVRT